MRGLELPEREEDFTADPVELFFDLAYVFAFSQLVQLILHDPTWNGIGQAGPAVPAHVAAVVAVHVVGERGVGQRPQHPGASFSPRPLPVCRWRHRSVPPWTAADCCSPCRSPASFSPRCS